LDITKRLISTLPEWAQQYIESLRMDRGRALDQAQKAERRERDLGRELAVAKRRIAELESKGIESCRQ
jgi:hypothetical protein